jgi:hypothetical protein
MKTDAAIYKMERAIFPGKLGLSWCFGKFEIMNSY